MRRRARPQKRFGDVDDLARGAADDVRADEREGRPFEHQLQQAARLAEDLARVSDPVLREGAAVSARV